MVSGAWRALAYGGCQIKKVLVVGASSGIDVRKLFEDEFVENQIVRLETLIYDPRTEKLIWSGLSDTWLYHKRSGSNEQNIRSLYDALLK